VISYRAYHRKVVRKARCDQLRREIREQIDLLDRCEAGDPEAIRQVEENRALAESYEAPEPDYPEPDYPEPRPRRYFADADTWADDEDWPEPEPDLPPAHAQRDGESDRAYRRRRGRPDLARRRAALLLAQGHWDANCPLPGAIREALCALSLSPRELRRLLVARWGRQDRTLPEPVPYWAPVLRELATWLRPSDSWLEVCPSHGPPVAGRSGSLVGLVRIPMAGGP
jgi:hypothetical protein